MAFLQEPTFWVLIAFVIFLGAAGRPLVGLITAGLDKRADKIREDLEEAEKLRKEAQDLLAGYQHCPTRPRRSRTHRRARPRNP
jgi:F-type H+-transporting ATPase subunit b